MLAICFTVIVQFMTIHNQHGNNEYRRPYMADSNARHCILLHTRLSPHHALAYSRHPQPCLQRNPQPAGTITHVYNNPCLTFYSPRNYITLNQSGQASANVEHVLYLISAEHLTTATEGTSIPPQTNAPQKQHAQTDAQIAFNSLLSGDSIP